MEVIMANVDYSTDTAVSHQVQPSRPTEGAATPVQVWLVDDNYRLRGMMAEALEFLGGIVCSRQFGSPDEVLSALASRTGPDVILLDVQMGEQCGLDAIPAIRSLARSTRVLMLTTFFDANWHRRAMDSGAAGYFLKSGPVAELAASIRSRNRSDEVGFRASRRVARQRTLSACRQNEASAAPASARPARASRKPTPLLQWLRRFAKN
jgi:DNA-binding NarL/FixJ family response regulator